MDGGALPLLESVAGAPMDAGALPLLESADRASMDGEALLLLESAVGIPAGWVGPRLPWGTAWPGPAESSCGLFPEFPGSLLLPLEEPACTTGDVVVPPLAGGCPGGLSFKILRASFL